MQESETTTVKARDYLPLVGLVAAAVFGVSLMCSAAVVGINDINNAVQVGTPTEGLVDFVISNMNTMIVETVQAFSVPEIIHTDSTFTATITASFTDTNTATKFPTSNYFIPSKTATRPPRFSTSTAIPPARTFTPTPVPPTPIPPDTDTPVPPDTDTPVPPDTDTPVPPDTDTPAPPDTDTPAPPDTDTPVPQDTPIVP